MLVLHLVSINMSIGIVGFAFGFSIDEFGALVFLVLVLDFVLMNFKEELANHKSHGPYYVMISDSFQKFISELIPTGLIS